MYAGVHQLNVGTGLGNSAVRALPGCQHAGITGNDLCASRAIGVQPMAADAGGLDIAVADAQQRTGAISGLAGLDRIGARIPTAGQQRTGHRTKPGFAGGPDLHVAGIEHGVGVAQVARYLGQQPDGGRAVRSDRAVLDIHCAAPLGHNPRCGGPVEISTKGLDVDRGRTQLRACTDRIEAIAAIAMGGDARVGNVNRTAGNGACTHRERASVGQDIDRGHVHDRVGAFGNDAMCIITRSGC
ncbi:MAG: hypothetical protein ACREPC_07075, partial [Stenotrophomonas sp.]